MTIAKTVAKTAPNAQPWPGQDKAQLRGSLRTLRRTISRAQQQRAAQALSSHLFRLPQFWRSKNIAAYWANDGEISLQPVIEIAWRAGKQIFLPIIGSNHTMEFHLYKRGDPLHRNQLGIAEPRRSSALAAVSELDLVIAPLVGFDGSGNRLGMGGGFYDRAMRAGNRTGPRLIGAAHSLQRLAALKPEPWDKPLQAVVTELGYINCARIRAWKLLFR
jgi:5-formyltetrahydrofolate cyclo-ligase